MKEVNKPSSTEVGAMQSSQFESFLKEVHGGLDAMATQKEGKAVPPPTSNLTQTTSVTKENVSPEHNPQPTEPLRRKRKVQQEGYQDRFFTRIDFTHRKPLYITASTHRKLMRIVHLMDHSRATISSYVENILLNHLDTFKEDINTIYQENSINPTEE